MGICLLSWPGRRTVGDGGGEEDKTADEVRAMAVRSISVVKVKIISYGLGGNRRTSCLEGILPEVAGLLNLFISEGSDVLRLPLR